jgi:hypothetical protein
MCLHDNLRMTTRATFKLSSRVYAFGFSLIPKQNPEQ